MTSFSAHSETVSPPPGMRRLFPKPQTPPPPSPPLRSLDESVCLIGQQSLVNPSPPPLPSPRFFDREKELLLPEKKPVPDCGKALNVPHPPAAAPPIRNFTYSRGCYEVPDEKKRSWAYVRNIMKEPIRRAFQATLDDIFKDSRTSPATRQAIQNNTLLNFWTLSYRNKEEKKWVLNVEIPCSSKIKGDEMQYLLWRIKNLKSFAIKERQFELNSLHLSSNAFDGKTLTDPNRKNRTYKTTQKGNFGEQLHEFFIKTASNKPGLNPEILPRKDLNCKLRILGFFEPQEIPEAAGHPGDESKEPEKAINLNASVPYYGVTPN
jgi:hypothetical protein